MLNTSVVLFFFTITILNHLTEVSTEEIEPTELRMKHQIFDEIKGLGTKAPHEFDHYKDMYDYVDNTNKPTITLSYDDSRNLNERYKQPELKTTTKVKYTASPANMGENVGPLKSTKPEKKKSVETFYRRMAFNPNDRDRPQKWMHCLDLLSPFLNGYLSNVTDTKKVFATDHVISRLKHLLTLDMTDVTTDLIIATLYEISNLQIRIYQWDVGAVKTILNVLIAGRPHDFRGLKYGIKNLFATWKLNTSNLTQVLTQSRIFRPPCIQMTDYGGSTVTPKMIRFKKPKIEKP